MRIFYAAGPGNIIEAHKYWRANKDYPDEMSITYSSLFEDTCSDLGAEAYIVCHHGKKEFLRDGRFILEHRPKLMPNASGIWYHVSEILYGLSLLKTAVWYRADVAVINSGVTYPFVAALFRLAGIRVVSVFHSTLWPVGFPPTRLIPRAILWLDSLFFRWVATATAGLSPECIRQVQQITKGKSGPLYQFRSQFRSDYYVSTPAPPPHDAARFIIVYAGRVIRNKGVFDILEMAKKLESKLPRRIQWEICGDGPDLGELRHSRDVMGLQQVVSIRGWTSPNDLRKMLGKCHLSIVPTRSDVTEGLAKTAVEAILAGRPVVTNRVVPALEILRPACVEASPDDVDSYVDAIVRVVSDANLYNDLCDACPNLQKQFYDRSQGLGAVLKRIFESISARLRKVSR
jgi:glycosyltransferase involved in cell wall biosynthesis